MPMRDAKDRGSRERHGEHLSTAKVVESEQRSSTTFASERSGDVEEGGARGMRPGSTSNASSATRRN